MMEGSTDIITSLYVSGWMLKKQSTSVLGSKPQHLKTKRQTQIQKRMDIIMTSGDNFVFVFLREREKAHACEQGWFGLEHASW